MAAADDTAKGTVTVFKGQTSYYEPNFSSFNHYYHYPSGYPLDLEELEELEDLDRLDELEDLDYADLEEHGRSNYHNYRYHDFGDFKHFDNMNFNFENGNIIIKHSGRNHGTVKITEDYELYINGNHIKTEGDQKRLLKEFYMSAEELEELAARVGIKGAKIGVEGTKLGLSAIGGLFKLLLPGYDTDDLERDLDHKAAILEKRAEGIEYEAEALEDVAYELEKTADELRLQIPELRKLRWF